MTNLKQQAINELKEYTLSLPEDVQDDAKEIAISKITDCYTYALLASVLIG